MTLIKYLISKSLENVKTELIEIMAREIKKSYVKTSWNNKELLIRIEKMGTSEIRILLNDDSGQCVIQETKRNVALMHKPFIAEVEKIVDDIMINKLGANKC